MRKKNKGLVKEEVTLVYNLWHEKKMKAGIAILGK